MHLYVSAGRVSEVLSILCRRNADILLKCRAEMTMVIKSQPLADCTDWKGCIHQKVLRFTDFTAHNISHHRDTGFCFEYMCKVKRADMKSNSQLLQLQRFNKVCIQILHDILNEFFRILFSQPTRLPPMQLLINNSQQRICQSP